MIEGFHVLLQSTNDCDFNLESSLPMFVSPNYVIFIHKRLLVLLLFLEHARNNSPKYYFISYGISNYKLEIVIQNLLIQKVNITVKLQ